MSVPLDTRLCRLSQPSHGSAAAAVASCRHRRRSRLVARPPAAGGGGDGGDAAAVPEGELPQELQGLCISEDGQHLIDSKTGKVVNEFGATRFDVAVQAMRGAFDPPEYMENTERAAGLLLDSLTEWPATYEFQVVVKQAAEPSEREPVPALLARVRDCVALTCADDVPLEACSAKERLGGKFVSLTVPARVPAAHVVQLVLDAVGEQPGVIMKY